MTYLIADRRAKTIYKFRTIKLIHKKLRALKQTVEIGEELPERSVSFVVACFKQFGYACDDFDAIKVCQFEDPLLHKNEIQPHARIFYGIQNDDIVDVLSVSKTILKSNYVKPRRGL